MGTKTKDERRSQLLDVAAKLVSKYGADNVTRRMVAAAAKVSEALVAHHFGASADAQKVYARHCKKLGLAQPSKEKQLEIGAKLRKHKPDDKRDVRKRSAKEVEAIKRKKAPSNKAIKKAPSNKAIADDTRVVVYRKNTAARDPKPPPPLPPLPPAG